MIFVWLWDWMKRFCPWRRHAVSFTPRRTCRHPGCRRLAEPGKNRCAKHLKAYEARKKEASKAHDERRGNARQRGYDSSWEKLRGFFLRKNPLCERCQQRGVTTKAEVVHHLDENPHNNKFSNLQALCRNCHERLHGRKR